MRTFRRLFALSALAFLPFAGSGAAIAAQGWRIDEAHTWIGFKIDAVGFPKTQGHFNHYSGKVIIDFDRPAKSFTSFTVDSTSIDLGGQAFNDFVKSSPLLNAEKYPTLSFISTLVEKVDSRTARVTGNLTNLGVTSQLRLRSMSILIHQPKDAPSFSWQRARSRVRNLG
jgi:polyisoprenoid-binding protein YceI